ncbi:MAG: hypothetical protein IJV05_08135 [Muribaculaceae bacterium]|nr:hypothetical protein [Muribaculaceae bacterium]
MKISKIKKLGAITAVVSMMMAGSTAGAQQASSATHERAWYEQFTYSWSGADGNTNVSKLTDEANDPYQIYELLKYVYSTPEIPGIYTDYQGNTINYSTSISNGWSIRNVTKPYENGYTVMLVKLPNDLSTKGDDKTSSKSDLINYFSDYVSGIELLTDGVRVAEDGDNAGTIFSYTGVLNKFFFIGKGKKCIETNKLTAPFYQMFEEFSPTVVSSSIKPIDDFYQTMRDGEVYSVVHDCKSVLNLQHYFSMAGIEGTDTYSMTNLVFYIPDNRSNGNREYVVNHQPKLGLYTITLEAQAEPVEDKDTTYSVTVDWTSSLNEMVGEIVPQTYELYVVTYDEQGNRTDSLLTTTNDITTYTYEVPQHQYAYTITYIVKGYPTDGNSDTFYTWSNMDDVVIPGYNDFTELNLGHYESDYVIDEEKNYYRNFLTISNMNASDLANDDEFTLYRCSTENDQLVVVKAAVLSFVKGQNDDLVHYEISYIDQDILDGYDLNTLGINDNGWLTITNGVVDMSPIMLCDQFAVSTASNSHPNLYTYIIANDEKNTGIVNVPVQKSNNILDGYYTLNEVIADDNHNLPVGVKNALIEESLVANPNIYHFSTERGDNTLPDTRISYLQSNLTANFTELSSFLGLEGTTYEVNSANELKVNLLDNAVIAYNQPGDYMQYVPIIWTFGTDRVKHDGENSYGAPILKTGVGKVEASFEGTCNIDDWANWRDENGSPCKLYNAIITATGTLPQDASIEYEPYMFRVWRLCDGIRGYKVVDGKCVNDPAAPRESDLLACEMVPNTSSETTVTMMDGDLAFGALAGADVKFLVRFYYVKKGEKNNESDPMFYVVETFIDNIEWNETTTGFNEVAASVPVTVTYVNAQGQTSDKPFDGLNIVITRHSDGTVKTSKMMK